MFQRLEVHGWRQFEDIQLDFHPQLTILTGANGAGKTTLLGILSRHVGWSIPLISTPRRLSGILRFISDWWEQGSNRAIGRIVYRSGATATLRVPADVVESYNLEIEGAEQVRGLFIPSHRPVYVY